MGAWRYYYVMPSLSEFPKSSGGNGTSTTQTPKVDPSQQFIRVWLCTIHPGNAAMPVYWRPECFTTPGQSRSERSSTPKGHFGDTKKVHRDNCIHKDHLATITRWEVHPVYNNLKSCHRSSGLSVGISRYFCTYTVCVSIFRRSISRSRSANT